MGTNTILGYMQEMAIFVKVVETESFSETARQLGVTPSAVSRAVSRLEKVLGTRLLQRTTRKLRLSESGATVYQRCVDMVNAAQAVMNTSEQLHVEPQGIIRLSVPKAVGRFVVHPHIAEFLTRYPQIDIQMVLDDRPLDVIDHQIDLAIRITNHPPVGMMGKYLFNIDHLLCATPQYLAQHGTPQHPHDLKNHSCIYLGEQPSDSRWKFVKPNQTVHVQVQGRYASNHTGVRLDAVLQHIGIGSLPYFTAREALQKGLIKHVLPDWDFQTYYSGEVWILYSATKHISPKLRVLIDFLIQRLKQEYHPMGKQIGDKKQSDYEMPEAGIDHKKSTAE